MWEESKGTIFTSFFEKALVLQTIADIEACEKLGRASLCPQITACLLPGSQPLDLPLHGLRELLKRTSDHALHSLYGSVKSLRQEFLRRSA